ncbi:MAG TPA: tRNA pseudouridine(38-40) synthase TruA [Candidatus Binataceae bacterium]|nr:tRNA pseudouridine(38-40) synthase TruA [Candidatus Binataceae bacterium]
MQVKLTLEYDGTNYAGWQLQREQDTIQGRLESALERIFSAPVRVRGAGRTDAGVHALGQVAAARIPRPFDAAELKRALNALLPPDIAVLDSAIVDDDFDPRRSAICRVYEYRILNRPSRSAFEYRYAWLVGEVLDLEAMNTAASIFVGEHDFAGFRSVGSEERSTRRRVYASQWTRLNNRFTYRVEAESFLRHMVRTMVSAMAEAGRGRAHPGSISELLLRGDRALAPAPAPAAGLFLTEVHYPNRPGE